MPTTVRSRRRPASLTRSSPIPIGQRSIPRRSGSPMPRRLRPTRTVSRVGPEPAEVRAIVSNCRRVRVRPAPITIPARSGRPKQIAVSPAPSVGAISYPAPTSSPATPPNGTSTIPASIRRSIWHRCPIAVPSPASLHAVRLRKPPRPRKRPGLQAPGSGSTSPKPTRPITAPARQISARRLRATTA